MGFKLHETWPILKIHLQEVNLEDAANGICKHHFYEVFHGTKHVLKSLNSANQTLSQHFASQPNTANCHTNSNDVIRSRHICVHIYNYMCTIKITDYSHNDEESSTSNTNTHFTIK
jgi:hypothetical protein